MDSYIYYLEVVDKNTPYYGYSYIGKHRINKDRKDIYFGSGKMIKKLIQEYGKDIFHRKIIVDNISNEFLLDELEKHYIRLYNTFFKTNPKGMNLRFGGTSGNTSACKNPEFRKRMSEVRIGKKYCSSQFRTHSHYKYKHTENTKEKMSLSSHTKKKITQFDINGNFIREFDSIRQASSSISISRTNIRYNLNNKLIQSPKHKFIWKYSS